MKLASLLSEERILVNLEARTLEEVVDELLETVADAVEPKSRDGIRKRLLAPGKDPPAVEGGACILHLREASMRSFVVALAVLDEPIPHPQAPDLRMHMIFLLLGRPDRNTLMLQSMAAIARLLRSRSFVAATRGGARSAGRIFHLIEETGIDVKRTITASDVMDPVGAAARLDQSLASAIETLSHAPDEGIPVLDERGRLAGELTSKEILQLGMPRYMDLLSNPEMLEAFEPFENFFLGESATLVREICRRDFLTVPPDAPIVSVAHMMITKNRRRVYVVEDDRPTGIVYRRNIVTRVMRP